MTQKACFRCRETKPIEEFYRHPMMTDGRLGKCKSCTKWDVRLNYERRREQYLAYEKSRANLPHRVRLRKKWSQSEAGRISHKIAVARGRSCSPEKTRARRKVAYEVRAGRLVPQPCVHCGKRAHAHHEDYAKPLEVVWLCPAHHTQRHQEMGDV